MEETLYWKKGLPTKPGWYWFRNMQLEDDREPRIYYVRDYAGKLAISNCTIKGWTSMEEGQWAGPISEPEEI